MRLRVRRGAAAFAAALALAGPARAATLSVDPAASRVTIHLDRSGLAGFLGHKHTIAAPVAEGRVEIVEEDPARSAVRLEFDSRQLAIVPGSEPASDVPSVETRMRGPEVLDVEHFQRIAFVSSSVVAQPHSAGGPLRLRVHGSLALKGRTFEVDVPVEVTRDGAGLTATGEAFLELRALGIEPPSVGGVVKVANRFRLAFELLARP
jgi:polyisoprenoid-binding protein YceI